MFLLGGCGEHAHDHEHEGHDHEAEIHAEEKQLIQMKSY